MPVRFGERSPSALVFSLTSMLLASLATGCKPDVESEKMEAARDWSKAICECSPMGDSDSLKCQAKHPKPTLELRDANGNRRYNNDSVQAFLGLEVPGEKCDQRITAWK